MPYTDRSYAVKREYQYYWRTKERVKPMAELTKLKKETASQRGPKNVLELLQEAQTKQKGTS